ncbi:hypothetical protein Tco_1132058 [Tanacetum coccineum]|uniref:Uncharacterized protein n=1 Tax=Tanacetum coccineum TaxID=301880 RepID=A0ABQ5JDL5_9ASTR
MFNLRKRLLLIQDHRGRQIIPKDYFINNDLEYLKHGDLSRRYSTSVTKTKAATYELKWIKDLVPELWNVYSRRRIITVTRLKIVKKYDYGHLEEIEVHRDDQKLYTFKEGDFKRLPLYDIEDLLLLLVQQKLTNLTIDERYDLNMALHMYTRRIVIQRLVKDLQLGVESYQKKLNLTKPDTYRSNLRNKTAYTSYSDPHGIIYVDQYKRKRLMHADELYKFRDGTLNDVRYALHNIAAGIRMEYPPMRKWSNLDKKKAWVMVQDMDKQLYQRRLMRNLEKFVGGRDDESLSFEDEGVTTVRAFMGIAEDELAVRKTDIRSSQWAEITMKKVQRLLTMNDGDERKHVLDYTKYRPPLCGRSKEKLAQQITILNLDNESLNDEVSNLKRVIEKWTSSKVTLDQLLTEQVLGNIVRTMGGRGEKKETISSKDVVFIKGEKSPFETTPNSTSNTESINNNQDPLPPMPKLSGAEPVGTSNDVIPPTDLI